MRLFCNLKNCNYQTKDNIYYTLIFLTTLQGTLPVTCNVGFILYLKKKRVEHICPTLFFHKPEEISKHYCYLMLLFIFSATAADFSALALAFSSFA